MKIEERDEREQQKPGGAFLALEITPEEPPRDPKRQSRKRNRQEVIGPIGEWKDQEPQLDDEGSERRMMRVAPRQLARHAGELGHVVVQILARLGENAVERPDDGVGEQEPNHGALAAARICKRIGKPNKT